MRKTLLFGLVAGVVFSMAPPAGAAIGDFTDVEGDVMTATTTDSGTTYHREGGAEGDINFARINHSANQVLVYLRFRQLSVPQQYGGFDYILEGNNGVQRRDRHRHPSRPGPGWPGQWPRGRRPSAGGRSG